MDKFIIYVSLSVSIIKWRTIFISNVHLLLDLRYIMIHKDDNLSALKFLINYFKVILGHISRIEN